MQEGTNRSTAFTDGVTSKFPIGLFAVSLLYLAIMGIMGYAIPRQNSFWLFVCFFSCFGLFLLLYQTAKKETYPLWYFLAIAILARLVLLGSWPALSEDFVRFLWDGYLVLKAVSPYAFTPTDWIAQGENGEDGFLAKLFPLLNSPDYYSVYPPLNQLFFSLAVYLGKSDVFYSLVSLRLLLVSAEIATILLIWKLLPLMGYPAVRFLWYALNPLVIIEISGNLHFDGLMLLFILGVYWCIIKKSFWSGTWFGLAVSVKLSPLILTPLFLIDKYASKRQLAGFVFTFFLTVCMCNLAVFPFLKNFFSSLQLYYGKFEFNASLYYLIRNVAMIWMDFNPILYVAPLLSMTAGISILFISFRYHNRMNIFELSVVIYMVYLAFQAVVHPWYILFPLGLSVFTRLRTFGVWSFLVFLSYISYQGEQVIESYWLISFQYLLVLIFLIRDWQNLRRVQTIN